MTTGATVYPQSIAERFELLPDDQRHLALSLLTDLQRLELATALAAGRMPWWFEGRPDQLSPPGDWRWWVINAGRGWGKTRTGGEWAADRCRRLPGTRGALIAPTFDSVRDTMFEGESGILSFISPTELRGGSVEDGFNRSLGEMVWANGSRLKAFSSEKPYRLRGPQHHIVWGDEPSYWRDAHKGTAKDTTFSNANIGLRLPPRNEWPLRSRQDYKPQGVLTMTPRMVPLLKVPQETVDREPHRAGLLQRTDIHLTTGTTMANLRNLAETYYLSVVAPMIGTTLGLQELGGILLEEVEGALWTQQLITSTRANGVDLSLPIYLMPAVTDLAKTVVSFDPAGDEGEDHDEHGIIVASSSGYATDLQMWVRDDWSVNGTPVEASRRVILAALEFHADAIVYEKNQGQKWIPGLIEATHRDMIASGDLPPWSKLPVMLPQDALTSKWQRATPIAAHYERRRVHHVGYFPVLEGQMTTWVPGESESPDRLDALVWAIIWLYGEGPVVAGVASAAQRERRGRRADQPSSRLPSVYGYNTRRG